MKKTIKYVPVQADALERLMDQKKNENYVLRLYVVGTTPQSIRAIENIKKVCEAHLSSKYTLEVIDLYQNPSLAFGEQIIAAPTLVKYLPLPLRRIIGDMSNVDKVLVGLDLKKAEISQDISNK